MVETMHEDSATGYSHHFPEDLPARPGPAEAPSGWRGRLQGRFWTVSMSSYDIIHTHDGQMRIRHITMIAILLLRAAMSGLSILSAIVKKNVAAIIIYSLLALLSIWFTATCLAIIGDAAGDRRVTGMIIKRWHFDAFLAFCLVIHTVLIILFFFVLGGLGLELTGIAMWLLILGVAWIGGWEPDVKVPTYQRNWAT